MAFGVTAEGFSVKAFTDIKTELEEACRAEFGENVDLSPQTFLGQIIGVMSERYAELWDLAQAVYAAQDPDQATESALEQIAAITGTVREAAESSTVDGVAVGTNGTLLSAGRVVSVSGTGVRFETLTDATIVTLSAWASSTAYAVGALCTNDSGKIYSCTGPGTSAGSGGPTGTGTAITDGGVTWRYIAAGTAAVAVALESEDTGPKSAAAGTLTVIETPVGGWSSFVNPLDAELGRDIETDAALRIRREDELRVQGTSPVEAIRSNLLEVEDVTACAVFENATDTTDGDGVPPHAIECLVTGGDDTDIAEAIFANKAAGIKAHGTTTVSVEDSQGFTHSIGFTRPTDVTVWVIVNLVKDPDTYPADGDAQVKAAIAEFGSSSRTGKDVVASALSAQAFSIDGVLDVTSCLIGTTNPPVASTTIAVGLRHLAKYDTSRITVNASNGTP